MSQQVVQLEKCFGQLYCKVEKMKCVGRNTDKEEELLDLIYIAWWINCGEDCDISCFLMKHCSQCKPTKNILPTADTCCGITAYNYISEFVFSASNVGDPVATGNPNEYSIEIHGVSAAAISSSPFITALGFQGLSLSLEDTLGGNIQTYYNIEDTPIPASFQFTAEATPGGKIDIDVTLVAYNEDGLPAIVTAQLVITGVGGDAIIEVASYRGMIFNNDDCNAPSFVALNNGDIPGAPTCGILVPPNSQYEGLTNLFTSGAPQLAICYNNPGEDELETSVAGGFFANCSKQVYAHIEFVWNCLTDQVVLSNFYFMGLASTDQVFMECSLDGIVWNEFTSSPLANLIIIAESAQAWDHALFPEGATVFVRIRSAELGVIFSDTITVDNCASCVVKFVSESQEFFCVLETGVLTWTSCWSWSELFPDNNIIMEYSLDEVVWVQISDLGNLPISQAPSVCYDIDATDLGILDQSIFVRFRDSVNDCISDTFPVVIPDCQRPVAQDFMVSQLSGDQSEVLGLPVPYSMDFTLVAQSPTMVGPSWSIKWIVWDLVANALVSTVTDSMVIAGADKTIVFPSAGEFVVSCETTNSNGLKTVSYCVVVVQDLAGSGDIDGKIAYAAFIGILLVGDNRPIDVTLTPHYLALANVVMVNPFPAMIFEIYENSGLTLDAMGVVQYVDPPYVVLGTGGVFTCDKLYNGTQNFQNRTLVSLEDQFPNYFERQGGSSQFTAHGMVSV